MSVIIKTENIFYELGGSQLSIEVTQTGVTFYAELGGIVQELVSIITGSQHGDTVNVRRCVVAVPVRGLTSL